ncbi:MAG TPA: ABC transporter permease [Mycobacteriales bacterium]|nr:ABC transporter permease [Mycobacteriales bacterium]
MAAVNFALAGLALGSIAALSGMGLLLTYRWTGVFNLAHGAIATLIAYLVYEAVDVAHWPIGVAAPLMVLGVAPALGVLMDIAIFRRLNRRGASPAESLVATLGVFALFLGLVSVLWGQQTRPAPSLFPVNTWKLGGAFIHVDALIDLGIVLLATASLAYVTARTRLGTEIRAVVDRRDLAELSAVNADRVSALGWAVGAGVAGLTGALIAPILSLNPYNLTLVILEIFAVPVIAQLASIPVAIAAGIGIGLVSSELTQVHLGGTPGAFLAAVKPNLYLLGLLAGLFIITELREVGSQDAGTASRLASRRGATATSRRRSLDFGIGGLLLAAPLVFPQDALRYAQQVPAFAIVFVSIVAIVGYSGQISLGQAGYAGLGALFFAKFSTNTPELVALLFGVVAAGIVGFLTGYPAIRRRGLFLALTTFAVGAFVDRFVFNQPYFTNGVLVRRPDAFGIHLVNDRAFYLFEILCLAVALAIVRNLRTGRLGRTLIAMRDSEAGARSVGINLRVLKIFIFTVSAALAGLGGALLVQTQGAFDSTQFQPIEGLLWFLTVVVFGADSAAWAVIAAALVVTINALTHNADAYAVPIGLLALLLAGVPGGVSEIWRRIVESVGVPESWLRHYAAQRPPMPAAVALSERGRAALARVRR